MSENIYGKGEKNRKALFEAFDVALNANTNAYEPSLYWPMICWWKKKSKDRRADSTPDEDDVWRIIFIVVGAVTALALLGLIITLILV